MRSLDYIPVIHAGEDLGRLREFVRRATERSGGAGAWERKTEAVEEIWSAIETWCSALPPSLDNFFVYQDGLPVCGHEMRIVADLARRGSRNHRLLEALARRGARIVGTESPELLLEEYQRIVAQADAACGSAAPQHAAAGDDLLTRRDAFIAGRIDATLPAGARGLIFIGMLHRVDEHLATNITVRDPLGLLEASRSIRKAATRSAEEAA